MEEYGNYISVALLLLLAILQPHRWNNFNRQCAEVNAVSIARNNKFDLKGAIITVANVRGPNSTNGIHGTPKPPCNVCQPLLDFYGIQYRE